MELTEMETVGPDAGLKEVTAQIEVLQLDSIEQPAIEKTHIPEKTKEKQRKVAGHSSSETPLGNLVRTKVSLGEAAVPTDSQISLKQEFGVEGTMKKIVYNIINNVKPITLRRIVESGSLHPGSTRMAEDLCLDSILKLHKNGLIEVTKNPVNDEIEDIDMGPKINECLLSK